MARRAAYASRNILTKKVNLLVPVERLQEIRDAAPGRTDSEAIRVLLYRMLQLIDTAKNSVKIQSNSIINSLEESLDDK